MADCMTDFDAADAFHSLDKNQALITQTLEGLIQRLDRQDARMDRYAKDIEALKERRWPANTTSIVMMVVGIAGFVFTMVKGILWRDGLTLQGGEATRLTTIHGMEPGSVDSLFTLLTAMVLALSTGL